MSSANYKRNSFYALVAKASGAVAALLTTMILTRALPEAEFGSYVLAYTFIFLGSILGSLGMGNAALRFAGAYLGAGRPDAARRVAAKCIAIGLGGLAALALLLIALHPVAARLFDAWPPGLLNATLIGIWLWGAGAILVLTSAMRAFGHIGAGAVAEITIPRIALLCTMGLLYVFHVQSLTTMLAAAALVSIAAAAWSLLALLRALPHDVGAISEEHVPTGTIAGFALPLLGANVLFQFMTDATLFAVASYCGKEEVALYGAAYRVWGFLGLPQNAVVTAIQGRLAELHSAHDDHGLMEVVRNSAILSTLPTLLITLVAGVAGGRLLGLLFGDFYAGGQSALLILCVGQLICVALGPCDHLLAMTGKQQTVLVITVLSTALAIALAWVLTPRYGILGAATAAALATVSFKILLAWQAYRQMGIASWLSLAYLRKSSSPEFLATTATPAKPQTYGIHEKVPVALTGATTELESKTTSC